MCTEVEDTENGFKDANEVEDTDREEMAKYYQRYNSRLDLSLIHI